LLPFCTVPSSTTPQRSCQSILDYARTKLFDPLGITTRPAVQATGFSDTDLEFAGAGFGWACVHGVQLGGFRLRLTPDMARLGQLYLNDGMWNGKRPLPDGEVAEATAASPLDSERQTS
jgi:CubicO group peptidase (beta-lactamase class C family)